MSSGSAQRPTSHARRGSVMPVVEAGWRCRRDPSHTRRRTTGTGCYDCHIAANRERAARRRRQNRSFVERFLLSDRFEDVKVTPAARAYLAAFDATLAADRGGDSRKYRAALIAKAAALEQLQDERPLKGGE
jgi:hypothetical protein